LNDGDLLHIKQKIRKLSFLPVASPLGFCTLTVDHGDDNHAYVTETWNGTQIDVRPVEHLVHVGKPNEGTRTSGSGNETGCQLDRGCPCTISGKSGRKKGISGAVNGSGYLRENLECPGSGFLKPEYTRTYSKPSLSSYHRSPVLTLGEGDLDTR
jgi:hypothetical protein